MHDFVVDIILYELITWKISVRIGNIDPWHGYIVLQSAGLYVGLYIHLSISISQKPYLWTSRNFLCVYC